ncbi:BRCA1-associated RING domain protein 1 [Mortierella sp. 14UC]|nr:BRCA1-associated RING domain protein 1 [Mortierella sp. 14UC]
MPTTDGSKCIYPVLGTDCVCPTCSIPARVGNLVKNPSYDILVACVTKLRNIRLVQDSNEARGTQTRPSQDRGHDPEVGTFIGSPIWTYDCGPTFPNPDHLSSISTVEAPTFPSVDAAMTMHRKEIDLQAKAGADQGAQRAEVMGRGQGYSFDDDGVTETFTSQQTEILGDDSNNPAASVPPPTISQLQRLLSIRKANSPTPQLPQESETPSERSPFYGDIRDTSHFSTPRMPTPSFQRSLLNLGSEYLSETERIQENNEQQTSNGPSRKRRMPTEEYTGRSGTPSSGSSDGGATSRNKKPSRANPRHDDRYLSDDVIAMSEPQAQLDNRNAPKSGRRKESMEPGASSFDGKRVWACTSCLKVLTIGRNIRIYECPECGQNQASPGVGGGAETSSSTTTTTDEELGGDDDADGNDDYGQVVESSQPTLDANMFLSMSQRNLPLLPDDGSENRSVQHPPSSLARSTHSGKNQDRASSNHTSTVTHSTATHSDQSISPVKSTRSSEPAAAISCVFTGLSKEQREKFDDNITRVIEAGLFMEHMPDQVFNESATHIITSIDPAVWKRLGVALCPRVLKYLVGMLSNGWIVRHEWFIDSIKSRMWLPLPNEMYLIQGDAQFGPAPGTHHRRKLRQQQSLKLFDSCRMFFYGEFGSAAQKSIKKQELLRLVQCGGASVLMKRPPKSSSSSSRARSRTPGSGIRQTPEPNSSSNGHGSVYDEFFSPNRPFLYLTEDTKPWQVPIDKSVPIIVCDPAKIPSGFFANSTTAVAAATTPVVPNSTTTTTTTTTSSSSLSSSQSSTASTTSPTAMTTTLSLADLKKHGWLRDFQAVSLTWVLNCISCSLMGKADVDLLYGTPDPMEIRQLDQAWDSWRANKS